MAACLGRRQCLPAAIVFGVRAGYTGRPDRPRERRGRWIPLFGASFAAERRNPCGSPRLFHVKRSYPGPKFGRPNFVPGSTGSHRPSRGDWLFDSETNTKFAPFPRGKERYQRSTHDAGDDRTSMWRRRNGGNAHGRTVWFARDLHRVYRVVDRGAVRPASERQSGRWPGIHANGRAALGPPCLPSDCYRGCSSVCSRLPVVQRSGGPGLSTLRKLGRTRLLQEVFRLWNAVSALACRRRIAGSQDCHKSWDCTIASRVRSVPAA